MNEVRLNKIVQRPSLQLSHYLSLHLRHDVRLITFGQDPTISIGVVCTILIVPIITIIKNNRK